MVLGNSAINYAIRGGELKILPFHPGHLQPASYDLTLAGPFLYPGGYYGHVGLDNVPDYEIRHANRVVLKPGEFVLASTEELIHLPRWIAAQVDGRSTMGRLGLAVHVTAGWIDPGFQGRITLEMCNHGPKSIELRTGDRIAQLIMCRVEGCSVGYCGRYQGQAGTVGARRHE